ncbi:peptidoglycan DD-metalloendopeptidase family protein [Enterococcus sp. AZ103]|uniref:peptidoglycan DD-metalloendopeptidase family protein n=1 Tax=Enterococcus sp. AZ103 TaxID=2774628 RepID=UPI003F256D11
MKKFSKILSALLISAQTFMSVPLNVFAEENKPKDSTEQVEKDTSTTESSSETTTSSESSTSSSSTTESSTPPSSSESSTVPSTKPSDDTTTSSSQTTPSSEEPKQETPNTAPEAPQQPQETPTPETTINQPATNDLTQYVPSATVTNDGAIHFEKDESVDSFIRKIGESARKIGQEKDLYASVMISQAILESASGQSTLAQAPNYNLFGIKGTHNGKSVSMATQEDFGNGNLYSTQAGFRVYEDYEDSFNDYATLLKEGISGNSEFYSGVWKSNAPTYQDATAFLTGKYATDTQYNQKLNGLIETYDLTEYDKEVQGAPVSATGYAVPVNNYTISSPFGNRGGEFHRGLDMAASQGEPIHASKAGTVIKAEYHYSWGNYVVIQHDDGMTTLYAHQQQYAVKAGDHVEQGQIIGYVGSTGNSTGAHLHLEICRDNSLSQGQLIDPASVIF